MKCKAISSIVTALCCPCCHGALALSENGASLACDGRAGKRHCYDLAKSGYVNLDTGHAGGGDNKELVRARTAFLESGAYDGISDALNGLLVKYGVSGLVIDAGCGEGYYTDRAARTVPNCSFLGVDLSKTAIDAAAKRANRTGSGAAFLVGGIFSLPIASGSAAAVLNLFAPCAEEEFSRVLRDGGILIVVGAGEDHLFGLKKAVYDVPYKNEPRADLPTGMTLLERRRVTYTATLSSGELIRALFSMTPYAFRTSREDMEKLNALDYLETEVDVEICVYRKDDITEQKEETT